MSILDIIFVSLGRINFNTLCFSHDVDDRISNEGTHLGADATEIYCSIKKWDNGMLIDEN